MSFLERYLAGEHDTVWQEIRLLGPGIRQMGLYEDATAVAAETMRRVAANIAVIRSRLADAGYQFLHPEGAYVPPLANARQLIDEIETGPGMLPLSLRAFYEVVGSVDFCQSRDQLVHYYRPERATAAAVLILGEEDPLEVAPLGELSEQAARPEARFGLTYYFASDEFHKANYSGGENYHVELPQEGADFRVAGMYGVDEWFVDYLRASIRGGGFRGRVAPDPKDHERAIKELPKLGICRELAKGLIEF